MYYGEAITVIDEKGRFTVPARMRQTMESEKHSDWIMTRGEEQFVNLYPLPVWQIILDELARFSLSDPGTRAYRRILFSSVAEVSVDRQGRMSMPQYLRERAGLELKSEACLIGAGPYLEVWNPELLRQFRNVVEPAYKDMAGRISIVSGSCSLAQNDVERVRT